MNNQNYIGSCLFIIRLDPDSFEKNRMIVTSENGYDEDLLFCFFYCLNKYYIFYFKFN